MSHALVVSIRFHDGRYHGAGEWPPAPARLFQALIAGAAKGTKLVDEDKAALEWLQRLDAPVIAAPVARQGQSFHNFVPNNDLDSVDGDLKKIGKIRTPKNIHPYIFDSKAPLIFFWTFSGGTSCEGYAQTICMITNRLYQLGRGVDMAWAWAELLGADEAETELARHGGTLYRPSTATAGKVVLLCPGQGSLASLERRFDASGSRFTWTWRGKKAQQLFSQPPKPRFAKVTYDTPSKRFLFELRTAMHDESFSPWPLDKTVALVVVLRDKAASRLKEALPAEAGKIARVLIGKEATEADKAIRARILPLLSIGHFHADGAIRRVLVEIPPNCPLRSDDLAWAFSGLSEIDTETGEILWNLVQSNEYGMLKHYGIDANNQLGCRIWRTITPAALPFNRKKSGITGSNRVARQTMVARKVMHALRHAGIRTPTSDIRVQREPFDRLGRRAETFAAGTRFPKETLWHVAVTFTEPVSGPLVLGDGRYLGLGLMRPIESMNGVEVFSIENGLADNAQPAIVAQAARRAMMARVQSSLDRGQRLPTYVSGHEVEGTPSRKGDAHRHVAVVADLPRRRILYLASTHLHRTGISWREIETDHKKMAGALEGMAILRAGTAGRLSLGPNTIDLDNDPLFAPARIWESVTDYDVTRHSRRVDEEEALRIDVASELQRRGWPSPKNVEVLKVNLGPRGGLSGRLRLTFATAQPGPLVIGRSSHKGGGLFASG